MAIVFIVLSGLSVIAGAIVLILSLITWSLPVFALSIITLINGMAWEAVDNLAETVEKLKAEKEA